MVLQCGACGARMKVPRAAAVDSRLLCPQCRAPVPTASGTSEGVEFRPSPLPQRAAVDGSFPSLPVRESRVLQGRSYTEGPRPGDAVPPEARGTHPEFDGRAAWEQAPPEGGLQPNRPEQHRRVKIKKRKAKPPPPPPRWMELTDWDHRDVAQLPEAEIAADPWTEAQSLPEEGVSAGQEREYLVEAVEEEGGQTRTTKKRVRRRRLLLGSRLVFQRLIAVSRYLTAGLALLVLGIALYGYRVLRQRYEAPPPVAAEALVDRAILTSYDALGAEKAVRDFLAADGVEAKLALVRQPERIRPLMQRWYRDGRSAGPMVAGEPSLRDKRGGGSGSALYYVLLAMPVQVPDPLNPGSTYEEMTFFAVEEIRNGASSTYLVDWETSVGYQELPLETFKATMPPEASPFRIYMKADNYYNHGFSELEWQCVAIEYPGRDFHLYGYISRSTREGRELLPLIEEGRRAGIIADLVYPPNPVSRDQVIVKRMRYPTWYFATAEDAAVLEDPVAKSLKSLKSN